MDFYHAHLGYMDQFGGNDGEEPEVGELVELRTQDRLAPEYRYYQVIEINPYVSPTMIVVDRVTEVPRKEMAG